MKNSIIYRGILLESICRYYEVKKGRVCSISEDKTTSTLTLTYTEGCTSKVLSELLGIKQFGKSMPMEPTNKPVKFNNSVLTINGLRLKKLSADPHIVHIVIVNDSESRVVQTYDSTTIVVSEENRSDQSFIDHIFYSGNLMYLQPIGPKPQCWEFFNFPRIIIKDSDLNITSDNNEVFTLRRRYDDYVIRSIDYQDQFISEIRRLLSDYGVELVRQNKEATLKTTSYVTYQFNQTPNKAHHVGRDEYESRQIDQRIPVEFVLRTTDMKLFFDFKNRYNNVDLLTNFCEFRVMDKYGNNWSAAVRWGSITEEFNHLYQSDDNSNFSYQCQFRCELWYTECLDDRYKFLEDIINNISTLE